MARRMIRPDKSIFRQSIEDITKLTCVVFAFCALLNTNHIHTAEKLPVVTTFTILADMAQNVAGDAATVVSVTKAGAEIHNYQPTPKDIGRTRGADLILCNGLNLEQWFEKFLSRLKGVPSVILSDGVKPMSINSGPYDYKPNPHV